MSAGSGDSRTEVLAADQVSSGKPVKVPRWDPGPSSVGLLGHFRFIRAGGFADNFYIRYSLAPADKGLVSAGAFVFARLMLGRQCRPLRL